MTQMMTQRDVVWFVFLINEFNEKSRRFWEHSHKLFSLLLAEDGSQGSAEDADLAEEGDCSATNSGCEIPHLSWLRAS